MHVSAGQGDEVRIFALDSTGICLSRVVYMGRNLHWSSALFGAEL